MQVAVLGTGMVGTAIASRLIALGHQVVMGFRSADNRKAGEWVSQQGKNASQRTFGETARSGKLIFLCTKGDKARAALLAVGADNLAGKVVVDVTNPLVTGKDGVPQLMLAYIHTTSLRY